MGCDIHLYTEEFINDKWVSVDKWTLRGDCYEIDYKNALYNDRNYNLFSILADVRNGYGFAGVKTGSGFKPISSPRGLPEDITELVKATCDRWGADGHSHSYLTIREILDFDWNQKTMLSGVVDVENWRAWKSCGAPRSWCGSVAGGGIKMVSEAEMEDLVAGAKNEKSLSGLRCEVEWSRYYWECAGNFPLAVMRALHGAAPHNVRFVFWFDN